MDACLHCFSHTPLVGFVDPEQAALDEVNGVIADIQRRTVVFDPELVMLFAPDRYNGSFYDVMPPFYLGVGATAIDDFASAAGDLLVPTELAGTCVHAVINNGIDLAISYNMQVDHGFAQRLEFLLGGLDHMPVLPVFISGVTAPLPGFQRAWLLGEAMGRFLNTLNKRVLVLDSSGLSHQPPVPELVKADAHLRDRLLGNGKQLSPNERERRQQRMTNAARRFTEDQRSPHPPNPAWDNRFISLLEQERPAELDVIGNDELSAMVGKSTHEIKTWVAAFAVLSAFDCWYSEGRYCRPIPGWIAGFDSLSVITEI